MASYSEQSLTHELLGPGGERDLAAELERDELALWCRMLSYAPLRSRLLEHIERALNRPPEQLERFRHARDRSVRDQAIGALAQQLRLCDPERAAMRAAVQLVADDSDNSPAAASFRDAVAAHAQRVSRNQARFVESNLRLVFSLARRYKRPTLPLDDLVQEGNIGLLRAVNRYQHRRGTRFSTYATWWIYHGIRRAVANSSSTIRVPVHAQEQRQRVGSARNALLQRLGREPTVEEIATHLNTSPKTVSRVRARAAVNLVSLDQPVAGLDGSTRAPQIADKHARTGFEVTAQAEITDRLAHALRAISPVQADVLRKRFGLDGRDPCSLQEIGDEYGLSRERIRQIEKAALARLRRLPEVAALRA